MRIEGCRDGQGDGGRDQGWSGESNNHVKSQNIQPCGKEQGVGRKENVHSVITLYFASAFCTARDEVMAGIASSDEGRQSQSNRRARRRF